MKTKNIATFYAILAAALYAINVPLSKILLNHAGPTMMASFLYLGAGLGLFIYSLIEKATGKQVKREPLTKKELPYTIGGGIGQSRILMLLLEKSHIAEVQASSWEDKTLEELQDLKESFLVSGSAYAMLDALMKAINDYDRLDVKLNLKKVLN